MREYPDQAYLEGLAHEAGRVMVREFRLGMQRELKSDLTPVTEADIQINSSTLAKFKRDFPHISFQGEEGSRIVQDSEYEVFCDPVDGTIPFCSGIPASTFCLSVLFQGVPIIGLIHDPFQNRTWYAEQGKETVLNRQRIKPSVHKTVARGSLVGMCWWGNGDYNLSRVSEQLMKRGVKCMNFPSIAIMSALVASGELVATIFASTSPLETAAIQVIVNGVGGTVTNLYGDPIDYRSRQMRGHIASTVPAREHKVLVDFVKEHLT